MANPITVGELTDVPAPNSPINAQFHQEVANRIIHRFATLAAMNAWTPADGSLAYNTQQQRAYARLQGAWYQLTIAGELASSNATIASLPLGIIAHANGTGPNQAVLPGTAPEITGCAVTFTADPARWYRTTAIVPYFSFTGGANIGTKFGIYSGSTPLRYVAAETPAGVPGAVYLDIVESGLSGSVGRRLVCANASAYTIDIAASPNSTAPFLPSIAVEDCGAV